MERERNCLLLVFLWCSFSILPLAHVTTLLPSPLLALLIFNPLLLKTLRSSSSLLSLSFLFLPDYLQLVSCSSHQPASTGALVRVTTCEIFFQEESRKKGNIFKALKLFPMSCYMHIHQSISLGFYGIAQQKVAQNDQIGRKSSFQNIKQQKILIILSHRSVRNRYSSIRLDD